MKAFKIAVVGFGNVGQAFVSHCMEYSARLRDEYDIRLMLVGVADSSGIAVNEFGLKPADLLQAKAEGKRLSELDEGVVCSSDAFAWRFKSAGVNLVVEALPSNLDDGQPALEFLEHAVAERMHLITANKGAMLYGLQRLETAAQEEGVGFRYSAATGGSLPTVTFGTRELAGAHIQEIEGVLNGTTNYILNAMMAGKSYATALAEAQEAGIAEPNPTQDVEGYDTAAKLVIMANKLMAQAARLEDVDRTGITYLNEEDFAALRTSGDMIRLIARARWSEEGAMLSVRPETVTSASPFYHLPGTNKALILRTDTLGEFTLQGGESSRKAIAATLLKDLIHIAREF